MTIAFAADLPAGSPAPPSDAVLHYRDTRHLIRVQEASVQLAILDRQMPRPLDAWLDALAPESLPNFRVLVAPDAADGVLAGLILDGALAGSAMARLLARDIDALVQLFARIARCDAVDIRLERISGNACWKFHRDHVPVRLLATYRGPGSEWVAPADADRALQQQERYEGPLHRMRRGAVGLFKGCAEDACAGIVHRSPPIAGTGRTRLLLCLNVPTAASPPLSRPRSSR